MLCTEIVSFLDLNSVNAWFMVVKLSVYLYDFICWFSYVFIRIRSELQF